MDREMVAPGIVIGNHGAGLHGIGRDPVDHEILAHHMGGVGQRGVNGHFVAMFGKNRFVVGAIIIKRGGYAIVGDGGRQMGRQRRIIDHDRLGGVLGLVDGFCHHQSARLSDMAHPVLYQGRARRPEHGRTVASFEGRAAGNFAQPIGFIIAPGENRQYPGHGLGGGFVDGDDIGVGMGRAQKYGEGLTRQYDVGRIAALAGHQPRGFDLGDGLTDRITGHEGCLRAHGAKRRPRMM